MGDGGACFPGSTKVSRELAPPVLSGGQGKVSFYPISGNLLISMIISGNSEQ